MDFDTSNLNQYVGAHAGWPFADYAKFPAVNASLLKRLADTNPLKTQHSLTEPEEEEVPEYFIIGTCVHQLVLEPDRPLPAMAVPPKQYPAPADCSLVKQKKVAAGDMIDWSGNATYCKQWIAEQKAAGKLVLSERAYEAMHGMARAIARHKTARRFFEMRDGRSELTLVWQDRQTGLYCKARADWVPPAPSTDLPDIKTSRDANPKFWSKTAFDLFYHIQAAHYLIGWNTLNGPTDTRSQWPIICVESEAPYDVVVFHPEPEWINDGAEMRRRLLELWADCIMHNTFPGYAEDPMPLVLPDWRKREKGML
jgi:hypothetical protein